ncbi:uncharacterized protein LOC133360516 [Lethenteron reissneri]|uniref:uncharacterized protein LOC133360516 n=1 Tax=Lethenteron reissneri TaxID=7753 RepID=UPI002AB66E93|nr:uncharacterized protein LOC133360516 [Lethenteron reissneri]
MHLALYVLGACLSLLPWGGHAAEEACRVKESQLKPLHLELEAEFKSRYRTGSRFVSFFSDTEYAVPARSAVRFACLKKFVPAGPLDGSCLGGKLNMPVCEPEPCRRLVVTHGEIAMTGDSVRHNFSSSLTCAVGYEGYNRVTCHAGVWEPTPVCCARPPSTVQNGRVSVDRERLLALLTCDEGYEPAKGAQAACRSGAFDVKAFACKERKCDTDPKSYLHVSSIGKGREPGSLSVSCKKGFVTIAGPTRCERGRLVPEPSCCPDAVPVARGSVRVRSATGSVSADLTCDAGLAPRRDSSIACNRGLWDAEKLACERAPAANEVKSCMEGVCVIRPKEANLRTVETQKLLHLTSPRPSVARVTLPTTRHRSKCLFFSYVGRKPWAIKPVGGGLPGLQMESRASISYGSAVIPIVGDITEVELELTFSDLALEDAHVDVCDLAELGLTPAQSRG